MKIRVTMDLTFEMANRNRAKNLQNSIVPFLQHAQNINMGSVAEEIGFIQIHECHHDEQPPQPCVITDKWEVGCGKVI